MNRVVICVSDVVDSIQNANCATNEKQGVGQKNFSGDLLNVVESVTAILPTSLESI